MRDYPPAHVMHEANCPDAPAGLVVLPVGAARDRHPNATVHDRCFSFETVKLNRMVVAEPGDTADHPYEPSPVRPPDATRALCKHCQGTHGDAGRPA